MIISLVTVTFNSERTLRDTIQSILFQSYSNIEYIIIDGLSKDSTIDIVQQYILQFDGRLKWISEKDKGLYDAMNKGIQMATGDIVGIINSDDFYHRCDVIAQVAETFQDKTIQAIYGDIRFVNLITWIGQFAIILLKGLSHPCFDSDLCLPIQHFLHIENILTSLAIIKQIIK